MEYLVAITYVLLWSLSLSLGRKKGLISNQFYIFSSLLPPISVMYTFFTEKNIYVNRKINPILVISHCVLITVLINMMKIGLI